MAIFIMTVGLPGSGKTTYCKNYIKSFAPILSYVHLSSDAIRKELYGDESIQEGNDRVFNVLNSRTIDNLKNDKNVIYDATNLTIKARREILNQIKNLDNVIIKKCWLFATPIETCLERNSKRERKVPEHVILDMVKRFQCPLEREGFSRIEIIPYYGKSKTTLDFVSAMKGRNQNNPHHKFNLDDHCFYTYLYVKNKSYEENPVLEKAARIHDIGKCYTETLDNNGVSHYYNHENYGAYLVLTLLDNYLYRVRLAQYINYHHIPFYFSDMKDSKQRYWINLFGMEMWNDLLLLHEADVYSSNNEVVEEI